MKKIGLIEKYNVAFAFFIVAITVILILNLLRLNIFSLNHKKVTQVYYADNISIAHRRLINRFNQKYAGKIEIIPINLPFTKFNTNERKELIARSLRSRNSRIDIFAIDQIWIARFAKWAEPLKDYFSPQEIAEILPRVLYTCQFGDQLLSIPLYLDVGVLFYRTDLLTKLPNHEKLIAKIHESIAWQNLIRLGQEYQTNFDQDQYFYLFQGDAYEGLICNYLEILASQGGELELRNKAEINNSGTVDACQFMQDLIYTYQLSPPAAASMNEVESYQYAMQNDIPFFRGWTSSIKDSAVFHGHVEKLKYLNYTVLPHFQDQKPRMVFGGWNLVISRHSEKKSAAIKFLKFVLSEEAQRILYETSGYLPTIRTLYQDSTLRAHHPHFPFYEIIMEQGVHRPKHQDYTRISDILSYHLNKALKKELSPQAALRRAADMITSDEVFLK